MAVASELRDEGALDYLQVRLGDTMLLGTTYHTTVRHMI